MTTELLLETAAAMKNGQIINYGGLHIKAIHPEKDWFNDPCENCPLGSKCTSPISILCAVMEIEPPFNWVMEEVTK